MGKVFRAQALVTSNKNHDVFFDAFLAVDKNKIVDVGPWKKRPRAFPVTDVSYGMITPGLFNLHTHLPMTLFRGIVEDLALQTWLFDYILPLEKKWVSPEFVRIGTELALCEAIRNGVTFTADMYYFEAEIARAVDRMGTRGLMGAAVMDLVGPDFKNVEQALNNVRKLHKEFKNHERIIPGIAPHSQYLCTMETLGECAALSKELDIPVTIHLAESKRELTEMLSKNEMTPAMYLEKSGLLKCKQVLLAHSVWLTDEDMPLVAKPNLSVVLNPQCNAKLASGIAPVHKYIKNGVRFALGTDGAASNNNTDIFAEMNFISKIHHLTEGDLTGLPGPMVFDSATRKSAEAVGLGDKLGSLEPGKEADFIIIDLKSPHLTPLTNPYAHLIYSVTGADVESVYVAGKCLMKNRKILVADESKILERANRLWKKIQKSL
ncbi:MAG: hypothetical protein JWQ35_2613 [Bacteriovoracaceae bacterium]|nr:hypothetical protein [Bacteriovoracaceae bacterium]